MVTLRGLIPPDCADVGDASLFVVPARAERGGNKSYLAEPALSAPPALAGAVVVAAAQLLLSRGPRALTPPRRSSRAGGAAGGSPNALPFAAEQRRPAAVVWKNGSPVGPHGAPTSPVRAARPALRPIFLGPAALACGEIHAGGIDLSDHEAVVEAASYLCMSPARVVSMSGVCATEWGGVASVHRRCVVPLRSCTQIAGFPPAVLALSRGRFKAARRSKCFSCLVRYAGERMARALRAWAVSGTRATVTADGTIGDEGATEIGRFLCGNTSLQTVDVDNNRIGPEGFTAISDSLSQNTTLTALSASGAPPT